MSRKNLYIIGARGFGREVASFLPMWYGFCDQYVIRGFLDDKPDALDEFPGYPPIVSSVEAFSPGADDCAVCALGAVAWRRKYIALALERGLKLPALVNPLAVVFPSARIGVGSLVAGHRCVISADVRVGDFVLMHDNVTLGHDAEVGDWSVIENGVFCGGGVKVGSEVTVHTRATILPHQVIGARATVGACSCVLRNVKPGSTVFGNPAQRIDE